MVMTAHQGRGEKRNIIVDALSMYTTSWFGSEFVVCIALTGLMILIVHFCSPCDLHLVVEGLVCLDDLTSYTDWKFTFLVWPTKPQLLLPLLLLFIKPLLFNLC